ncbi:hypothetical protein M7I_7021 [Glarea lozoyensis 74030]|uniref:Uncharacterized protein n=1 Tax=Glarea lozoyensis (strain ATCC 74030 / MF5533) TaxID=1104152 RepID=H0EW61_GLAL7|nr:hypothetical protein M7I_7021 [Glarea lozoyensis 74030]
MAVYGQALEAIQTILSSKDLIYEDKTLTSCMTLLFFEIIYALSTRKSSYLGDEQWMTVPWQRAPKSDFHHLLDIMAKMPGLVEQTELAISRDAVSTSPTDMESLRERYWAIERQHQLINHTTKFRDNVKDNCLYDAIRLTAVDRIIPGLSNLRNRTQKFAPQQR